MNQESTPYLSVVVTCRNDDHGGSPLLRLQAFVNSFNSQCRRTGLDAEVIVVDWNPPGNRPPLADAIQWPSDLACAFRFVEVPPALHNRLRFSDKLPLFQMIAKNVGIRRAAGRFVLSTNIDIIFADDLVSYFASGQLQSGHLYRVNRHDIESDFPVDGTPEEQMGYCRSHHLRVHHKWGSYAAEPDGTMRAISNDIVKTPLIRLTRWWHVREAGQIVPCFRWAGPRVEFSVSDVEAEGHVLEMDVESHPGAADSFVELALCDTDGHRLGHAVISGLATFAVALPGPGVYTLEVLSAPDLRSMLPSSECRDTLLYRVCAMRLRTAQPGPPPVGPLGPVAPGDALIPLMALTPVWSPVHVADGPDGSVVVTTAPGKASYAVEWKGVASASGTYEFCLDFEALEGNAALGVLSGSRTRWLATGDPRDYSKHQQSITLKAELAKGEPFWLVVSNLRHYKDAPSIIRIRRLVARGPDVRRLLPSDPSASRLRRSVSAWSQYLATRLSDRIARRLPLAVVHNVVTLSETVQRLERQLNEVSASRDRFRNRATELEPMASHAEFLRRNRPACLHLNACGDFQLMAREHWFDLLGFAEAQTYSMNLDGLFCYAAHYAGITEHVFEEPLCIYHLEHETGSGYTPEGEQILRSRMDKRGIPWVEWPTVATWASYMHWLGQPLIFSRSDWGFGAEVLHERTVPATSSSTRRAPA